MDMLGFEQDCALEDAIESHACSFEANMRATNSIPFGCQQTSHRCTINCVATLKVTAVQNTRHPGVDSTAVEV
jgi:hypothetical protein